MTPERPDFSAKELERLTRAASVLKAAQDPLAVIRATSWPADAAARFFAAGARALPQVDYPRIDPYATFDNTAQARALINGSSAVHTWLRRLADVFDDTARMLSHLGQRDFHTYSQRLFGGPDSPFTDDRLKTIDLAERLDAVLQGVCDEELLAKSEETLTAERLQSRFRAILARRFKQHAPRVEVTPTLSARATAGRDYIRIRADSRFSERDATQLLHHEAFVHIATGVNGRAQTHFPLLGEAHPGNTRTQEGLAVFAEFVSGALGPHRLRRLAGRVIGVKRAMDGADFVELYDFFRARGEKELEAFDMARRTVRGGLVTGGAPFTKDVVYLGGLLDVHNYLRAAIRLSDTSLISLLFCGKFDLQDIEALRGLQLAGVLNDPIVVAPWADDMGPLVSYLAYSTFLNDIDLTAVSRKYDFLKPLGASGDPPD